MAADGGVELRALDLLPGTRRIDRRRARLELTDVSGLKPRIHQARHRVQLGQRPVRQGDAVLRQRIFLVGELHVGDERQAVLFEAGRDALGGRSAAATRLGRSHSASIGHRMRVLQLLWTPGKQQRQHRILQEPGFGEIRAREPQIRQLNLEVGVVPERNRDGLVRRQAVLDRDAWRNDGALGVGRSRRDTRSAHDVGGRRHWGMRRTPRDHDRHEEQDAGRGANGEQWAGLHHERSAALGRVTMSCPR